MQDWEKNLKERGPKRLKEFKQPISQNSTSSHLIIESPCDLGVIRNGGKRGAKHGPQALMAPFLGMVAPEGLESAFDVYRQNPSSKSAVDFDRVQNEELEAVKRILAGGNLNKLIHLGGGHDHVYPLGAALQQSNGPIVVINIDAHLDTRPDSLPHSGTPFRQLLKSEDCTLYQLGIHNFANGQSNYEELPSMEVLSWEPHNKPKELKKLLRKKLSHHKDATLILSVDCDGLDASYMPAVSAPNHLGLSQLQFLSVMEACQEFWKESKKPQVLGLYEYNPIYDGLSQSAARFLAQVMYRFFYEVGANHE